MIPKLSGAISLKDLVSGVIDDTREKLAASEGDKKDEKKEKVNRLVKYEKKEHGHIPTPKEEEEEKKASASPVDDEEVSKLASALDQIGDELIENGEEIFKAAADALEHGGEYKGGGESLPVMKPVSGKQPYSKDGSKSHNVPQTTSSQKGDGGGPAATQVKNDHAKAPGGAPYPKKGVMKTAGSSVLDRIRAAVMPVEKEETEGSEKTAKMGNPFVAGAKGAIDGFKKKVKENEKEHDKDYDEKSDSWKKDKKASDEQNSVDFILAKIANVEKKMGGETLDSKSGEGPKPPSDGTNSARSMISSNSAATDAKKVQAKAPQKKLMSQVLTEPMQSKAHDHKVSENLRNATKGGVKIAAARALLQKIAEDKDDPRHAKMKEVMEKKKEKKGMGGGMPMTGASGVGSSMPRGPMM